MEERRDQKLQEKWVFPALYKLRQQLVRSSAHDPARVDQAIAWRRGRPKAMSARARFVHLSEMASVWRGAGQRLCPLERALGPARVSNPLGQST